jgi:hypothetical protein
MTKIWKTSRHEETITQAVIVSNSTDWQFGFDKDLGVPRTFKGESGRPATIVLIEPDHPPDDFVSIDMFVVSERLKHLFEQFAVHAEFLDIRVITGTEEYTDRKFYCCDILDGVDCFDHSRGECTFHEAEGFTDHIDKIKKFAINEQIASQYHLFRIAKGGEYIVCVSDDLANAILDSGLTGMRFVEPEEWSYC